MQRIIPTLSHKHHKGSLGKIGIIGGCLEYTGAPYYAGMSAMRVGVDLAHIFCSEKAGLAIKSYSPDLIVHPILPDDQDYADSDQSKVIDQAVSRVSEWLPRMTSLVIGPGMGRGKGMIQCAKRLVALAREKGLPMVIDGDGLSAVVCSWPDLVKGYSKVVLTPNWAEYRRLCVSVGCPEDGTKIEELCEKFGGVTIVQKGEQDVISNGQITITCDEQGSPRRCGGQGDLTAGFLGALLFWADSTSNT